METRDHWLPTGYPHPRSHGHEHACREQLLGEKGTPTPQRPLPALVLAVFLWEPFTSSEREVCVYFSSSPFDSDSPLFFCQRARNKFRF